MQRDLLKLLKLLFVLLFPFKSAIAASQEEIDAYPEFAEKLEAEGYNWETHKIKTEEGWYLMAVRIMPQEGAKDPDKLPLLLVHGSFDSAIGYISRAEKGWALFMPELGYDVWVLNSRGVKYSDKNERDGEWTLKEKWNFSWADMGIYDLPATIDYITEETGSPKVTVLAHSQGTSQMLYGMSHKQDYFAEKVERFVALAACTAPELYPFLPLSYNGLVSMFVKADEFGYYNIFGSDESTADIFRFLCDVIDDSPLYCISANYIVPYIGGPPAGGAQSTRALLHYV